MVDAIKTIQEDRQLGIARLTRNSVLHTALSRESRAHHSALLLLVDRDLISTSHGEESVSRVWTTASFAKVVVTSLGLRGAATHVSLIVVGPATKDPLTLRSPIMR